MDYYSNPAISASGLKLIAQSPAHYYARCLDPEREPFEATAAMQLGTATHCAVLEPEEFDNRYAVVPEGLDYRSKEGKAVRDGILAVGKTPIKYDDMQAILKMQKYVQAHPYISSLRGAEFELEHFYYFDGVAAKMKPDLIIKPCAQYQNGLIIDLKTTTSAKPDDFARVCFNGMMYIQAAFYIDSFQRIYGTVPAFAWCAVESKIPHLTAVYKPPQHLIEFGREEYLRLLEIYRECTESGVWYGYDTGINELELPAWAESIIAGGGVEINFIDEENA